MLIYNIYHNFKEANTSSQALVDLTRLRMCVYMYVYVYRCTCVYG